MFKTILITTTQRLFYGFGFGIGMGVAFKVLPIERTEKKIYSNNLSKKSS